MTTTKDRLTIYLRDRRQLEDLAHELRLLSPIAQRGAITRSTVVEAAVRLALEDLHARGAESGILKTMVTLPDDERDGSEVVDGG